MSTNTFTGLLHLPKHGKPRTNVAADGTFQLTLPLRDRQGTHQVWPWLVLWSGPEAQAWWQAHGAHLQPGASVRVQLSHLRPHGTNGRYGECPEIHARVESLQLAPARWASPAEASTNPFPPPDPHCKQYPYRSTPA